MRSPIQITIRYFEGCPSWTTAEARVREVIEQLRLGDQVSISFEIVSSAEDAEAAAFRGSPTVLIDGADRFGDESAPIGLSCRVYKTENGLEGAPSKSQLRDALESIS